MTITCRAPLRIDLAGGWSDIPPFARAEGGAVLNVAITRYVTGRIDRHESVDNEGFRVSYGLDLPSGAGLGSSASLSVAWLALVHASMSVNPDQSILAREACDLADLLNVRGGKQDEYAAALGGVHLMRFGDDVTVEPLSLDASVRAALEKRLIICYTGQARLSSDIHDRVWGAYERGDRHVAETLGELRDVAIRMAPVMEQGDFEGVAALMNQNWTAQKRLHHSVTNARVDALVDAALRAGARAAKACGAGGGGCVALLVEPQKADAVRATVERDGVRIIDAGVDWDGVVVQKDSSEPL